MKIGTFYAKNNGACVFVIGGKNIIPGQPAMEITAAEAEHPIVKAHIEAGRLQLVEKPAEVPLDKKTVPQLLAYAEEKQYDLDGATVKADILAKIKEIEAGA